jgi:hypothetical protein
MTEFDWHASPELLTRFAADPGTVDDTTAASLEAHLVRCPDCRRALGGHVDPAVITASWDAVAERIDQPRRPLRRSTGVLQASVASPALVAASAVLAVTLLVVVGIAAAVEPSWSVALLVAVAPIGPVAAAVVAFWPTTDPAGSLSVATPLAGGRLPFLRALFATAVSAVAGLLSSVLTPLGSFEAVVWLLPGLAFAAIVIAVATWIEPVRLAVGLGAAWWTACALWVRGRRASALIDAANDVATHALPIAVTCITVIVLASLVTLSRRDAQPNWRTA